MLIFKLSKTTFGQITPEEKEKNFKKARGEGMPEDELKLKPDDEEST